MVVEFLKILSPWSFTVAAGAEFAIQIDGMWMSSIICNYSARKSSLPRVLQLCVEQHNNSKMYPSLIKNVREFVWKHTGNTYRGSGCCLSVFFLPQFSSLFSGKIECRTFGNIRFRLSSHFVLRKIKFVRNWLMHWLQVYSPFHPFLCLIFLSFILTFVLFPSSCTTVPCTNQE